MSRKRRYGFTRPYLIALFSAVDGLGSILATAARALRLPAAPATPDRILLINLAHIGDALMISPALRVVRARYPEAHISVLVGPWSKDVLAANPHLDEVIVFRPSWWDRERGAYLRPSEFLEFIHFLKSGRFQLSINFKSFFQENLALWLAGIPARTGYGIYGGGFLLTHQVEHDWNTHTVERNLALVTQGGASTSERPAASTIVGTALRDGPMKLDAPEMFVFEEDNKAADAFLAAELGSRPDVPLFAFHIGAGYPSKLWGEEKYAELAGVLAAKWGARIVVVGGKDDLPLVDRMQQLSGEKLVVAAGKLSIREMAALFSCCCLFVGNDSGPAHIAAAMGIPTIAIFSGENEASAWRPYSGNSVFIQHHPACFPCGKKRCDIDHRCMESISVSEVLDAAERILNQAGSF